MTITNTNRTFGIEIEAMMPESGTHEGLARHIRMFSREAGRTVEAMAEGYNHNTRAYWKVITDASLPYGRGVEVVSPILSGSDGIEQVRMVADAMTDYGCTVNVRCGLHVHIGVGDMTVAQIKKIAICFVKFETFFDHIMPASRRADNNRFVQSNRSRFGSYATTAANDASDAFRAERCMNGLIHSVTGGSRYRKLNLQSYHSYKTIEFRQHSGTTDADKMSKWIELLVNFVEAAPKTQPKNRVPHSNPTPEQECNRFFRMFKVAKDVRDFYHARREVLN